MISLLSLLFAGALFAAQSLPDVIRSIQQPCGAAAITFDLCPVRNSTKFDAKLVEYLKENRIPTTFFVSGSWLRSHPAEFRSLSSFPLFEFGTHSDHHPHITKLPLEQQRREIEEPVQALKRLGFTPRFYRPPFGEYDEKSIAIAKELGLTTVLWSAVSGDSDPKLSRDSIVDRVNREIGGGGIAIFHANGNGVRTSEVIPELDQLLTKRGLHLARVGDLADSCPETPAPALASSASPHAALDWKLWMMLAIVIGAGLYGAAGRLIPAAEGASSAPRPVRRRPRTTRKAAVSSAKPRRAAKPAQKSK